MGNSEMSWEQRLNMTSRMCDMSREIFTHMLVEVTLHVLTSLTTNTCVLVVWSQHKRHTCIHEPVKSVG